jgi:hypothetical protein
MANTVYMFNCGVNPISSLTVNGFAVTGTMSPWPPGVAATPSAITPTTIPLNGNGTGTPTSAALVAGDLNTIQVTSQQVVYSGTKAIDLTKFTMQSVDNLAMFIFFGSGATFGQQPSGGSLCQVILTDTFGEFTQAYFIPGSIMAT